MAYPFRYLSAARLSWRGSGCWARGGPTNAPVHECLVLAMLAFACAARPLCSQVVEPEVPPVRFTVFALRPIAGVVFTPAPEEPPRELEFYPTARSPHYAFRGSMPLRFTATDTGALLAEATIPADIREALLLFAPLEPAAPGGSRRYRISIVDDAVARHGPGGLSIINLSGLALTGTVNRSAVALQPGLNPTLLVRRTADIILRATFGRRSYQSHAGTIALEPNERALLILFAPFYAGSPEVQTRLLVDTPPGDARIHSNLK